MSKSSFFGEKLQEQRLEAEIGLRELGRAIGVSHSFLCDIEAGRRVALADKHLPKLVDALKYDHPVYWLEWWQRVALVSRIESAIGATTTIISMKEEYIKDLRYDLLEKWVNCQIGSGRFNED